MVSSAILFYFKRTTNLCLFQLGNKPLHPKLQFPKASTVTLINCSREGVSHVLKPSIFPNLNQIHYLSGYPADFDIHNRFNGVQWFFPTYQHNFYQAMIQAGIGRVENRLISTYIREFKVTQSGTDFDLNIPGFGLIDGAWYANYQRRYLLDKTLHMAPHSSEVPHEFSYLYTPNPNLFDEEYPYFESGSAVHSFMQKRMEDEFLDHLKKCDKK